MEIARATGGAPEPCRDGRRIDRSFPVSSKPARSGVERAWRRLGWRVPFRHADRLPPLRRSLTGPGCRIFLPGDPAFARGRSNPVQR